MGLKFKVVDYKLEIDENVLLIPEFVKILKADKNRNKKRAKQLLTYIYLREDLGAANPLSSMSYDDRKKRTLTILFTGSNPKFTKIEQEMLDIASKAYVEYSATPEERLLFNLNEDIDEQNKMMTMNKQILKRNVEGLDETADSYTTKVIDYNKDYSEVLKGILENLDKLQKRKKQTVDMIKGNVGGNIRGNKGLSLSEQGNFLGMESETGK